MEEMWSRSARERARVKRVLGEQVRGLDLSGPLSHTQNRNGQAGCFDLSEAKA